MPNTNLNDLIPYLPHHLATLNSEDVSTGDALTIAIHIASVYHALSTYLPHYLVQQIEHNPVPGEVDGHFKHGTVMFADVSGFTAMSEKLSALGKEGAEEVTSVVNDYFETMLNISVNYGGDLLKFGGDALLIFFEGDLGPQRAIATGQAMQQAMGRFKQVKTSQGIFPLKMSIGMGTGPIFVANLGSVEGMEYAVMGRALANMAKAEDRAVATQVMVDQTTRDATAEHANFAADGDGFWLLQDIRNPAKPVATPKDPTDLTSLLLADKPDDLLAQAHHQAGQMNALKPFLPEDLFDRVVADPHRKSLEGAHRPVTVMFANFYGIDEIIETLGPAHEAVLTEILNTHFVTMNEILAMYGGVVNKVDTYAIGHRIMALFGALKAHEDDPQRAVRAALAMNHALEAVNQRTVELLAGIPDLAIDFGETPLKQRIGLNTGFVFAGNVGATSRREYSVMGDEVNLTARLMGIAQENQVLISHSTQRHAGSQFVLEELTPVMVKGKSEPVRNYAVTAEREQPKRWEQLTSAPIIGREQELAIGRRVVGETKAGEGRILIVSGVSGIGKTRLAEEVAYYAEHNGLDVLAGTCLSYGATMTYHPWAEILRSHFSIQPDDSPETRLALVEKGLNAIDAPLWTPVIAEVLGLQVPDNELTRNLDAKLRRQRVLDLTLNIVQHRAKNHPLMIVVEDAHWADPASMDMINYVARNTSGSPIILLLPHRPDTGLPNWRDFKHSTAIDLEDLSPDASMEIVRNVVGPVDLPDTIRDLILNKGGGNPFFLEEVARTLIDADTFEQTDDGTWIVAEEMLNVELPDTIHGMIISRIDRLLTTDRRILQVASVIGRVFEFDALGEVYPYVDLEKPLQNHIDYLCNLGLTEPQVIEYLIYRFKHLTTREVVYESLSFEQRRSLHRAIGEFIETAFADRLGEQTDLLAYHFFTGHVWDKAMTYNLQAARRAQHEFANDSAVAGYQLVLEAAERLENPDSTFPERLMAHESLGEVLNLLGRYDEALTHYTAARELVTSEPASVDRNHHLADLCRKTADVYEKKSEYDAAFEWLEQGLNYLDENEPTIEAARIHLLGAGVYYRQGKHEDGITWCQKSSAIAEQIDTSEGYQALGQTYYLLGALHWRRGNLERAVNFCKESIKVYDQVNDEAGISHAYNNLALVYHDQGDWNEASKAFEKGLTIKKKIGDVFYQGAIANNLANILLNRGLWDKAANLFKESTKIWQQLGAVGPEGITTSNLAQVHINQGNLTLAHDLLAQSKAIFTQVGADDFLPELERRWAEYYFKTQDMDKALGHIQQSLDLAAKQEAKLEEGMSLRVLGQIEMVRQERVASEQNLRRSLAILNDLNSEYEIARTQFALAQLLLTQTSSAAGQTLLNNATKTFEKLGAQADLAQAHQLISAYNP